MFFDYYGRLIGIKDANENATSFTYDDSDKLIAITTPEEKEITFSYNENGRLGSITDTHGRITKYVYNNADPTRLEKILSPEFDAEHPWAATTFTYNSNGTLASVTDQSGYFVKLTYGSDQVVISEHTNTAEITDGAIAELDASKEGEVTTVKFRSPYVTAVTANGKTTVYQMDNTGRVTTTYEEKNRVDSSRITVSNSNAFAYSGEKRVYSVQTDETKPNLITNGNFSSTNGWIVSGGGLTAYSYVDGSSGIVLYGNPDYDRYVRGTVTTFVGGKTHYLLSLWAKATSAQIDTERCTGYEDQYLESHVNTTLFDENAKRRFGIKAIVNYVGGGSDTFYASFDWYNTDWQLCQLPMCLKGTPTSMEVRFEYGYNVGNAYIDNFRLTDEYGTESKFSDDGKLLWQCDGTTQEHFTYNGGAYPVEVLEVDCADAAANKCSKKCNTCNAKTNCKHGVNKYGFNAKGQFLWSEDRNGIITKNTYDDKGRQTASFTYHESDPTSKFCSESTYDDLGREVENADVRGEVNGKKLLQKLNYEAGTNLVSSIVSAGGKKTTYGYHHLTDACVSLSADDNGSEHTNRMNYTAGLLTRVDNCSGICYNYVYDGFCKLTEVKINGETVVSYGEPETTDGKRSTTKTLDGITFTETTDEEGKLLSVAVNGSLIKEVVEKDDFGRCTKYTETLTDGKTRDHIFNYDNHTHEISGVVKATYDENIEERTKTTTYAFSGLDSPTYTFQYENDFENTLKSVNYNNELFQTFAKDKLGRQTESRLSSDCGSTVYTKKASYLKYGDHATGLVSDLTYRIGEKSVDREKYSYDAEGNISAIHENGKLKVRYTYDSLNRLIREDNRDFKLTTTFAYDNGGNIIRQNEYAFSLAPTDELVDGTELVYEYGNEYRPDQLTSFKGKEITYDANGCPTSYLDNKCSFTRGTLLSEYQKFDDETQKYVTTTFWYDADGIRTKKGNITFTYIDGKLIRQEGGTAGQIDFIYGASGIIGFKHNDNTIYWYRRNLMGDVTHIYNMSGKLCAKYVYDAWGNHQIETNENNIATINPIRYRGYYYDVETELYYLQTRYYDPETGRFISQDDVSYLTFQNLTGLNLYAYCLNNPIRYCDPSGQWIETLFDLFSLGVSIVEVVINPYDPLNWAGLVGDALDLIPFVTGVGETVKGVRVVAKSADLADDTLDTIRFVKAADMLDDFGDRGKMLNRVGNATDYHNFTISNHVDGTRLHTLFMKNGGYIPNTKLKYDGLDDISKNLFELKPYNKRNVRKGVKQIIQYKNALGEGYNMIIVLY